MKSEWERKSMDRMARCYKKLTLEIRVSAEAENEKIHTHSV